MLVRLATSPAVTDSAGRDDHRVRRSPALLPRHDRRGRSGHRPPVRRPPWRRRRDLSPPAQRDRGGRAALAARAIPRRRSTTRRTSRRSGARSVASSRRCTSASPSTSTATRSPRLRLPTDRVPSLDEVSARLADAQRLALPARGRARRAAHVLRRARRAPLSLDAVRAPSGRAAVHARAGHRARGDRPRAPARDADVR